MFYPPESPLMPLQGGFPET